MPSAFRQSDASFRLVVFPLAIMLVLTVAMGVGAYQITQLWGNATQTVQRQMTEVVIWNNVHQNLITIKQTQISQPKLAKQHWQTLSGLLNSLSHGSDSSQVSYINSLLAVSHQKAAARNLILDPALVDYLTQQNWLQQKLTQTEGSLNQLQTQSRELAIMLTGIISSLGAILMGITARELLRLFAALRYSRDLNISLQEEERKRIAQDLHDGVVQDMIDLKRQYNPDKIDKVIEQLRRVCHNLKPQILEDLGLQPAISLMVNDLKKAGVISVKMQLDANALNRIPKNAELPLFRVIQEVGNNIKHHAKATEVSIQLQLNQPKTSGNSKQNSTLSGIIKDNGCGFDPKSFLDPVQTKNTSSVIPQRSHMGLTGARERMEQLGGRFWIESQAGQGTSCHFELPL